MLRRIFRSKSEETNWRKLLIDELRMLHCSSNVIRVKKLKRMTDERYIRFFWKARRKRSLGRPRHRGKVNIKIDLRNIGWGVVDLINGLRVGKNRGLVQTR
jgi:hypothetical protein